MNKKFLVWCVVLSGCAIHPLPEDFSGVDTQDIVRQIRCETRYALIDMTARFLAYGDNVDDMSRAIGAAYFTEKSKAIK